jgi:hypothetical protein
MRLNWLIFSMAALALFTGCSPKQPEGNSKPATNTTQNPDADLLLRVRFAGTTALIVDTNAAYLTNLSRLPETAALRTRIVERLTSLPGRLLIQHEDGGLKMEDRGEGKAETLKAEMLKEGANLQLQELASGHSTFNIQHSTSNTLSRIHPEAAGLLEPVISDMLTGGFVLELRGDSNGVTAMSLAAKAPAETARSWQSNLVEAAKLWFGAEPVTRAAGQGWTAGDARMSYEETNGQVVFRLVKNARAAGMPLTPALPMNLPVAADVRRRTPQPLSNPPPHVGGYGSGEQIAAIGGPWNLSPSEGEREAANALLQVEMTSSFLPQFIQQSVYGGFARLKFTVTAAEQSLKVRGTAAYPADLPSVSAPLVVPTNLVHETLVSFTTVRNPAAWLPTDSAIRRFLPKPAPESLFFWGGEMSPYQFTAAVPCPGNTDFTSGFGQTLVTNLEALATATDSGPVIVNSNSQTVAWNAVPFVSPTIRSASEAGVDFLVAGLFPESGSATSLPPQLVARVTERTNQVLFDWEFTAMRLDSWLRVGQLAVFLSNNKQLGSDTASLKWLMVTGTALPNGGNTVTEITQTGPRELTLARRAPLGFTSTELFWLANWLESSNFPAANFLMPVAPAAAWKQ